MLGEYADSETHSNPIFTVADGIVWLSQQVNRHSSARGLQVVKVRGQAQLPGIHSLQIGSGGLRVFPRSPAPALPSSRPASGPEQRQRTGVVGLDEMLGGGLPAGYSLLVAGPSGSGKSTLAQQFVLEGVREGQKAVIAVFESTPEAYLRTSSLGPKLAQARSAGQLEIVYLRLLDLSVEETLAELQAAMLRTGADRVVIDSLSGFELALGPPFREDFREALYRMVSQLTGSGATVVLTLELEDSFTDTRLSPGGVGLLSDAVVLQRYVELDGSLRKVLAVVKLRARPHSKELRLYEIEADGLVVGDPLPERRGILTGVPVSASERSAPK